MDSTAIFWVAAFLSNYIRFGQCVQNEHPHIIFVLADDLGWNDVSFHGSEDIPTPNLDTFAYDGVLLSQYYVQPICTPTRGALLTGRHPIHLGLQHGVILTPEPYGMGLEEVILPQYLKELGYKTHIVGKWHLGFYANEYTPTYRGFDTHFGYYAGRQDYWDHTINEVDWGLDFRRNMDLVKTDFGQYGTEVFTEEAEQLISLHNTSEPMFLFLSHLAVHTGNSWQPLQAPWEYYEKFDYIEDPRRRTYAAMVSYMDDSFARIVEALDDRNMLENSIVVFSTDNGGASNNFQQGAGNNLPLRGLKETYWEGGVRGAGFIWSPLLDQSGYTSDHMMQHPLRSQYPKKGKSRGKRQVVTRKASTKGRVTMEGEGQCERVIDWLPTLLYAAGYDISSLPENVDGINQWEVLSQNLDNVRTEMLHNIEPVQNGWALRKGDMKLVYAEGGFTNIYPLWYGPHGPTDSSSEGSPEEIPEHLLQSKLNKVLKRMNRNPPKLRPFTVNCGDKPENATTNCNVSAAPCLFNVTADPCEYHNVAHELPEVVDELMERLIEYSETAVAERSQGVDPASFPRNHQGFWIPWIELGSETNKKDGT